jgi:hypothetical protein
MGGRVRPSGRIIVLPRSPLRTIFGDTGSGFWASTLSAVSHDWRSRTRVTFGRVCPLLREQRHEVKHLRHFQVPPMPRRQARHNGETRATEGASLALEARVVTRPELSVPRSLARDAK